MLTKEKLRHYLAFECAIREIAAVSDRHCLATDNPRTTVATISLSLSLWARFTRAVRSLSRLHPSLLSSFTTLACLVRGVYLHKPANCVLVSFVPYERPFQYSPDTRRVERSFHSRKLAIRANLFFPLLSTIVS